MEKKVKEKAAEEDIFAEDEEEEDSLANRFLLFNIGEEVYGIPIEHVTEIIEMQKVTDVPDMPCFVKGVINLRGRVIPVIDLRLRFGMEERGYDDRTCIIVVNVEGSYLGFIVDTVAEVQDILDNDIEPPPVFRKDELKTRYILGLGKVGDQVKILIDVNRLLHEDDLITIKEQTENKEGEDV